MFSLKKNSCIILVVFFLAVNIFTLHNGHHWGDFAQYIIHAQNILHHQPYNDGISVTDVGIVYPPGLPLLIAPILHFLGLNFIVLKFLNVIFWYTAVFFIFKLLINRIDRDLAMLFCIFMASSFYFFMFKQSVLSDVPFAFFSAGAMYFFSRYHGLSAELDKRRYFFLFLMFISGGYLFRAVGLIFFLAALFYFSLIQRNGRNLLWILLSLGIVDGFKFLIMGGIHPGLFHPTVINKITHSPMIDQFSVIKSCSLVFLGIFWSFSPAQGGIGTILFSYIEKIIPFVGVFCVASILGIFFYRLRRKTLGWMECFTVFYLSMLFLWTVFGDLPEQFARYMFPLWMPLFVLFVESIFGIGNKFNLKYEIIKNFIQAGLIVLILINIVGIATHNRFNNDEIYLPQNRELSQWIKNNLQPDEHYLFSQDPRPLAMLTGRTGTALWLIQSPGETSMEQLLRKIRALQIGYWIMSKSKDAAAIQLFDHQSGFVQPIWENSAYKVFRLI